MLRDHSLQQAVIFGVVAACAAILIAVIAFPIYAETTPVTTRFLSNFATKPELREKCLLLMIMLSVPAAAWVGALWRPLPPLRPLLFLALLLAFPILLTLSLQSGFLPEIQPVFFVWNAATIGLALAAPFAFGHKGSAKLGRGEDTGDWRNSASPTSEKRPGLTRRLGLDCIVVAAIVAALVPIDTTSIFNRIAFNEHVIWYVIGPSLYDANIMTPGIDYYTQYSIGQPWLFGLISGNDINNVWESFIWAIVISMILFFITYYMFLLWLIRDRFMAVIAVFSTLILQFHLEATYMDPSSYVVRHPLIPLILITFAAYALTESNRRYVVLLAGLTGASLFLNTETGILILLAVGFCLVFLNPNLMSGTVRGIAYGIASLATFFLCAFLAFGSDIISAEFVFRLIEPLLIYGAAGVGTVPVSWDFSWGIWINVVAPGVALVTIGWALATLVLNRRSGKLSSAACARFEVIVLVAIISVLISVKYWNMSLYALWVIIAFGFITLAVWWINHVLVGFCGSATLSDSRVPVVAKFGLVLVAVVSLWFVNDPRWPGTYAFKSYQFYPSVFNLGREAAFPNVPRNDWQVSSRDVALIKAHSQGAKTAMIVINNDWALYLATGLSPRSRLVPVMSSFTHDMVEKLIADPGPLFVGIDGSGAISLPVRGAWVLQFQKHINENFKFVARGDRLAVLNRKE